MQLSGCRAPQAFDRGRYGQGSTALTCTNDGAVRAVLCLVCRSDNETAVAWFVLVCQEGVITNFSR
jgi:hypothetical protein